VRLVYSGFKGKPLILTSVEDLLTGKRFVVFMLVDTGADKTCFPEKFAAFFGHDNSDRRVKRDTCRGIGGSCRTYIHSIQVSLLNPRKPLKHPGAIAWTSAIPRTEFVEKMDTGFGLLGMDVIKQWKSLTIQTTGKGLTIKISV
jgi:hypothetical protein